MADYLSDALISGSTGATIGLALFGVLFAFGILYALIGAVRGVFRQSIRTLTIIAAVVIAFFATVELSNTFIDSFANKTVADFLTENNAGEMGMDAATVAFLSCFDAETLLLLLSVPMMTIALPIAFVFFFLSLATSFLLVHWIVSGIFGFRKSNNSRLTRLLGALLGFVQGVAIFFVLLIPAAGFLTLLDDAVVQIEKDPDVSIIAVDEDGNEQDFLVLYHENVDFIVKNPIIKFVNAVGGKYVFDKFTEFEAPSSHETISIREDLIALLNLSPEIASLSNLDFKNPSENEKEAVSSVIDKISDNKFLLSLVSGLVRGIASSVDSDAFPIETDDANGDVLSMLKDLIGTFKDSNNDNVCADLQTIKNIYFILVDRGVLATLDSEEDNALMDALTKADSEGKTTMVCITDELKKNPHTEHIVTSLMKTAMNLMASQFAIEGVDVSSDVFEAVSGGAKDILCMKPEDYADEEEYIGAIESALSDALTGAGIDVDSLGGDSETVSKMAEAIANSPEIDAIKADLQDEDGNIDPSQISDGDIAVLLLTYFSTAGTSEE